MNSRAAGWAKGLAKYGVGCGLLAWVVVANWTPPPGVSGPGMRDLLQGRIDPVALAGSMLLLVTAVGVQTIRWFVLLRALDVPLPFRDAVRVSLAAIFYNTVLPGAVGGDLVRSYAVARACPGRRAAGVASVLVDRLIGLYGLVLHAAVAGGGLWALGDTRVTGNADLGFILWTAAAICVGGLLGWLALGVLPQPADRAAGLLARLPGAGRPLAGLFRSTLLYRRRGRAILGAVALSAAAQAGMVGGFDLAARTFIPSGGLAVGTLAEHFVVVPVGFLAMSLFPAPGGIGGGEAAFGWLYRDVLGKPAATGIAATLALRLLFTVIGVVGYLVYLRMGAETPLDQAERAELAAVNEPVGARHPTVWAPSRLAAGRPQ